MILYFIPKEKYFKAIYFEAAQSFLRKIPILTASFE